MTQRGLLVRLVERLYVWATEREQARFRRANPEWDARLRAFERTRRENERRGAC